MSIDVTDEVPEILRTNDMAMVSYLRLMGHAVQEVFWDESQCYWKFLINQGLLSEYEKFVGGKALVDPREFSKYYAITKRELHRNDPNSFRL